MNTTEMSVGMRVCGGTGEDYDEGYVLEVTSNGVIVGWDSGVRTWSDVESLRTL